MKKCDFCTQSSPKGKCLKGGILNSSYGRSLCCEEAIKRMEKDLKMLEAKMYLGKPNVIQRV